MGVKKLAFSSDVSSKLGLSGGTLTGGIEIDRSSDPYVRVTDGTKIMYAGYITSSSGMLGTTTNHPLEIRTNNTARLTFSNSGISTFSGNVIMNASSSVAVAITNTDTTDGYGLAVESQGTSNTRYNVIFRNNDESVIYGGISTMTNQVGHWGIGYTPASTLASRLSVNGGVSIGSNTATAPTNGLLVSGDASFGGKATITGTSGSVVLDVHTGKATFGDAGTTYCTINQNTLMFKSATGDIGTSTEHNVHFKTNSTTRMTISSSGLTGIQESSPTSQLHLKVSSASHGANNAHNFRITTGSGGTGSSIMMGVNDGNYGWITAKNLGTAELPLYLNQGGGDAQFGGKLGIGRTPVNYPLEVAGHVELKSSGRVFLETGGAIADNGSNSWLMIPKDGSSRQAFYTAGSLAMYFASDQVATFSNNISIFKASNSGNPEFHVGASATEKLHIQSVYASGTQTLSYVTFNTYTASTTANAGQIYFAVDEDYKLNIHDSGVTVTGDATFSGDISITKASNASIILTETGASALRIDSRSDGAVIRQQTQDKDIYFDVNDGGTNTEVIRIKGSDLSTAFSGAVGLENNKYFTGKQTNGTVNNLIGVKSDGWISIGHSGYGVVFANGGGSIDGAGKFYISNDATFSEDIFLKDNKYLYLGDDSDLEAIHTGTHGHIINNTGNLYLKQNSSGASIVFHTMFSGSSQAVFEITDAGIYQGLGTTQLHGTGKINLVNKTANNAWTGFDIQHNSSNGLDIIKKSYSGSGDVTAININTAGAVTFATSPVFTDLQSKYSSQYPTTATLSTADTVGNLNVAQSNGAPCELKFQINGTTNTSLIPNVSYHWTTNSVGNTAYNQYFKMADGTNIGQIEFHPTGTSQIVTRVNQPLAFGVNNSHKITIGTDGKTTFGGRAHIKLATAGSSVEANTENDDLVIETNGNTGMTMLSPDANDVGLGWGSASLNRAVLAKWNYDANSFRFRTNKSNAIMVFGGGESLNTLTLDGSGNSTFDGKVRIGSSGSPDVQLHVQETASSTDLIAKLVATRDVYLQFWADGTIDYALTNGVQGARDFSIYNYPNNRHDLTFASDTGNATFSGVQLNHISNTDAQMLVRSTSASHNASITIDSAGTRDAVFGLHSANTYKWLLYNKANDSHKFKIQAGDGSTPFILEQGGNATFSSSVTASTYTSNDNITIKGASGADGRIDLGANAGASNGNWWRIQSTNSDSFFKVQSKATGSYVDKFSLNTVGDATFSGTIHTKLSSAGNSITAHGDADNLVVESGSGNTGITILNPSTNHGAIFFGDEDDADAGKIDYDHDSNSMKFAVNGSALGSSALVLNSDSSATFNGKITSTGVTATHELLLLNAGEGNHYPYMRIQRNNGSYKWDIGMSSDSLSALFFKRSDGSNALKLDTDLSATFSGDVIVNDAGLQLKSTNAGADVNPTLSLIRDSASPTIGDKLGMIEFKGEDTMGASENYVDMYAFIDEVTHSIERGGLHFRTMKGGTKAEILTLKGDTVIIGHNYDTTADGKLHIAGIDGVGIALNNASSGNNNMIRFQNGGQDKWDIGQNGNGDLSIYAYESSETIINIDGGTEHVTFSDRVYVSGSTLVTSDIRYKSDIATITNSLDTVSKLRGVSYKDIRTDEDKLGVIAQEVEAILPTVVATEEHKSVDYNQIIPVLIESIKELKTEVESLKAKLGE